VTSPVAALRASLDHQRVGREMYEMVAELYPLCRSITGPGVRQTLDRVADEVALDRHEVPSGTPVLDWTVPLEWEAREAWIKGPDGGTVVDFRDSNLHLVGYSTPVRAHLTLDELQPHLFSLPDRPGSIPYRTSYYTETWGFCLPHARREHLEPGTYEVFVDAELREGSLSYGEALLEGERADEILLSTHVCHPSLCNDNLSGIVLLATAGRLLSAVSLRHSLRLLFIPGTIGSLTWLARNEHRVGAVRHGMVLTGLGDDGAFTYKRSRRGDATVDRAAAHALAHLDAASRVIDFHPYGYDERQFCSPGFDLPVGRLGRSSHGEYPEYHTSADDLGFVRPERLAESLDALLAVLEVLEGEATYVSTSPKGEPQLGRRGLYRSTGGDVDAKAVEMAYLWVMNQADGSHSLLDVAERAQLPFPVVRAAADALLEAGLLR
jgi:aminopeptidase-like protein